MSKPIIKNIVFDADGTLLEFENPYLAIAKVLKCDSVVRERVQDYLDHKISYQELVDLETALFISQYKLLYNDYPKTGDLERFLPPVAIVESAKQLVDLCMAKDIKIYILSSGFLYLCKDLMQLKVELANIHANRFLYDTDGTFIMIKIDVTGEKIIGFDGILTSGHLNILETVYVGDNAFDAQVINYVLENNGHVFFLKNDKREFKLEKFPTSANFVLINGLEEIESYI